MLLSETDRNIKTTLETRNRYRNSSRLGLQSQKLAVTSALKQSPNLFEHAETGFEQIEQAGGHMLDVRLEVWLRRVEDPL